MSKQTVKGFMFMEFETDWSHDDYTQKWRPRWWPYKRSEDEACIFVKPMELEFEVPDDFNPIPGQVAALEREKAAALEKYQQSVADINARLSKLLALTNEVEA